ncbi:MAG: tRNA (adenosine(37)-N6)-threonylcarbamoyltransferase complex dimerization subunit type 1 TsaB, partial [Longimicrobiales bacterium]
MALLLAIDTATSMGSVAIGDGDRVLAELTLGVGTRHSAALLPAIRFALEHAGLEPGQIDGVVVGAGPGSFTGVRIAAATAKALVHATQRPLYAYSTLLALAAAVVPAHP